jgi:hypothetical protein
VIVLTGLNFEIRALVHQLDEKAIPSCELPARSQQRQRLTPFFYTDALKRQVAGQPLRSAVVAWALAMLLIRTQLTKRAEVRKWDRMRMR